MAMELSPFAVVLLFAAGSLGITGVSLIAGKILRPNRPNEEKLTTYESGEDPVGTAWGQFNPRYYIIALIFILFEVELIFLFPWATVFGQKDLIEGTQGQWAWLAIVEMFLFIGILFLGLVWAWGKGFLDWVVPKPNLSAYKGKVPVEKYEEINQKYK